METVLPAYPDRGAEPIGVRSPTEEFDDTGPLLRHFNGLRFRRDRKSGYSNPIVSVHPRTILAGAIESRLLWIAT
jgi:hypothetical protein